MKFKLFFKDEIVKEKFENTIVQILRNSGCTFSEDANFVIVIGGDGTLLRAIHSNNLDNNMIYFQINAGNIGYHSIFPIEELSDALDSVIEKNYKTRKVPIFKFVVNGIEKIFVNELTISTKTLIRDCIVDIENYGKYYFSGSNITISTPFGSTGYSLYNGGSYISSDISCYQILTIGSIKNCRSNYLNSNYILHDKNSLSISYSKKLTLKYDHKFYEIEESSTKVSIMRSDKYITICYKGSTNISKRL